MKKTAILALLVLLLMFTACGKTEEPEELKTIVKTTLYEYNVLLVQQGEVTVTLKGEIPSRNRESGSFSGKLQVETADSTHTYKNLQYRWVEGMLLLHSGDPTAELGEGVLCWLDPEQYDRLVFLDRTWFEPREETELLVYINEDLSDSEAKSVGTKLNSISGIERIQLVSREEGLEAFRAAHGEDEAFAGIEADDLRHRYYVTVKTEDLETVLAELEALSDVAKVGTGMLYRTGIFGPEQDGAAMLVLLDTLPELE